MWRACKENRLELKRVAVVCLVGLVASSCGWSQRALQANDTYRQNVESWIGEPLELLLKAWGTPDEFIDVDQTTRAFSWRSEVAGASTEHEDWMTRLRTPGKTREAQWVCETIFLITEGRVRDVSFQGNDCKPRKKYPAAETVNGADQ